MTTDVDYVVKGVRVERYTVNPECPNCGEAATNTADVGLYCPVYFKCGCGNVYTATRYDFWKNENK